MSRTDPYRLTVSNHKTGARFSFVGSLKECKQAAAEKQKEWKGAECVIEKRK